MSAAEQSALNRELGVIGALALAVVLAFALALAGASNARTALTWLTPALLLLVLVAWQAWHLRILNRRQLDAPLLPDLGWGNRLTLIRGGLIAMTGGFLLLPLPDGNLAWLPGVLYGCAALLDRVDGFVARRSGRTTLLGERLDTVFDALGLVIAPLVAVMLGKLHISFLLVSVAFYWFQAGLFWRRQRGKPVFPLLPSQLRRTLAGFQMGFVAVVLLPPLQPYFTRLLGWAFMLPLLLGFLLDWCVVSGRVRADSLVLSHWVPGVNRLSVHFLLPALRLVLCILVGFFLLRQPVSTGEMALLVAGSLLALLGVLGRIGALLVLLLLAIGVDGAAPDLIAMAAALSAVVILLLGGGQFSLWRGDDAWVNRHDGAGS